MRDLDDASAAGLHMLCAAPTGTGKTVAAIFPLLGRGLREKRKLFFVTANTSQQALALATLERLIEPGRGVSAVQITAKERVCPRDGELCRPFRCQYQRAFQTRLAESGLLDELSDHGVVEGDRVARRARDLALCPFEVSLALAERAAAVVGDFNYVFDPRVRLRRFFEDVRGEHFLIVDEAHNLPARAVGYLSPSLALGQLEAAIEACRLADGLWRRVAMLLADVQRFCSAELARLETERDAAPVHVATLDRDAFDGFAARAREALADRASLGAEPPVLRLPPSAAADREPLVELLSTLDDLGRSANGDPETLPALFDRERLRVRCLDPAPFLREAFQPFRSALCMSATLLPLASFARELGIDAPGTLTLELGSAFPRANRKILNVTSVDTRFRERDAHHATIARILDSSVRLRRGNYLAFFSSFAYRDQVVRELRRLAGRDYDLLLQLPGVRADAFLARLRAPRARTQLLCAVQGGIFGEGVDYPGGMAIGVFVIGPGLPSVSLEQELVREYHDRRGGDGFARAYLLPGLARSVQAGGRAIRTPTDRAFIMLICRRFADPDYRNALPRFWREECVETDDPVAELRAFWGGR